MKQLPIEFKIRDDLWASYDIKDDSIIFRVFSKRGRHNDLHAVATVVERPMFGVLECYSEATMTDDKARIEDFRILYDNLKYYISWFQRSPDSPLIPFVIDKVYLENKYGGMKGLMEHAKKLTKENNNE